MITELYLVWEKILRIPRQAHPIRILSCQILICWKYQRAHPQKTLFEIGHITSRQPAHSCGLLNRMIFYYHRLFKFFRALFFIKICFLLLHYTKTKMVQIWIVNIIIRWWKVTMEKIDEHFFENMPSLFILLKILHKHAPFRD
jgi:hypothetical protein